MGDDFTPKVSASTAARIPLASISTVTEQKTDQVPKIEEQQAVLRKLDKELQKSRQDMDVKLAGTDDMELNPIDTQLKQYQDILGKEFTPTVGKVVTKLLFDREQFYWNSEQLKVKNENLESKVKTDGKKNRALAKEQMRKIATLRTQVSEYDKKLRYMEQQSRSFVAEFAMSKSNSADYEDTIDQLEKENKKQEREIARLNKALADLQNSTQDSLDQILDWKTKFERRNAQANDREQQLRKDHNLLMQAKENDMQAMKKEHENAISKMEVENHELQAEAKGLKKKVQELEADAQKIEKKFLSKIEGLQQQNEALEKQVESCQERLDEERRQSDALRQEKEQLQQTVKQLQEEKLRMGEQVAEYKRAVSKLELEVKRVEVCFLAFSNPHEVAEYFYLHNRTRDTFLRSMKYATCKTRSLRPKSEPGLEGQEGVGNRERENQEFRVGDRQFEARARGRALPTARVLGGQAQTRNGQFKP